MPFSSHFLLEHCIVCASTPFESSRNPVDTRTNESLFFARAHLTRNATIGFRPKHIFSQDPRRPNNKGFCPSFAQTRRSSRPRYTTSWLSHRSTLRQPLQLNLWRRFSFSRHFAAAILQTRRSSTPFSCRQFTIESASRATVLF